MKPRKPGLKFEDALPHWCPNAEFAQITNAGSLSLPYVETYLNRVMLRAKDVLIGPRHARLRDDIDLFVKQESNHYRQHRLFNQKVEEAGYDAVKPIGAKLQADYDSFLATKSLRFNTAYCEGFEKFWDHPGRVLLRPYRRPARRGRPARRRFMEMASGRGIRAPVGLFRGA